MRMYTVEQRNAALRVVWAELCDHFFNGEFSEFTYDDFISLGQDLGLLAHVRYDPKKHGFVADAEPGDEIVVRTKLGKILQGLGLCVPKLGPNSRLKKGRRKLK